MALPQVSGEFTLVADPELKFAASGTAVAKVRLVANSQKKNDETGKWDNDKTVWLRGVAFKKQAENIAESFAKGDLVMVTGRLQTEEWEKDDGTKGQAYTVLIDSIGASVRWDPAKRIKAERSSAGSTASDNPWESSSDDIPF